MYVQITQYVIFIIISLVILVQSEFLKLNVRKVDKKMTERKRQDTLEMCRIFEEETERSGQFSIRLRVKRSVNDSRKHYVRDPNSNKLFDIVDDNTDGDDNAGSNDNAGGDDSSGGDDNAGRDDNVGDANCAGGDASAGVDDISGDNNPRGDANANVDSSSGDNKASGDDNANADKSSDCKDDETSPELSEPNGFAPNNLEVASVESTTTPITDSTLTKDQSKENNNTHINVEKSFRSWKHGVVPYFIDPKTYDNELGELITNAFIHFEKSTCIRLQRMREYPSDEISQNNADWVYITNPAGIRQCVHSNEKKVNKGVQVVVFGYDCMSIGDILHEVMHVLGFPHEHTRHDRDEHVKILWENIKPGYNKFFVKRRRSYPMSALDSLPYDHDSLLHYPQRAFSKNGKYTIVPTNEENVKMGQRDGLSATDIHKVKLLYEAECVERNHNYLQATCPSVLNPKFISTEVTQDQISDYFKNRIWDLGIVNYAYKTINEFTTEEKDNIRQVIKHIEKETCIQFNDLSFQPPRGDDNNVTKGDEIKDNKETVENVIEPDPVKETTIEVEEKTTTTRQFNKSCSPKRRHSEYTLTLTRSNKPGCDCPEPGKSDKEVVIGNDCFNTVNDMLHMFVHILGLDHQHDSYDRDAYLLIDGDELPKDNKSKMQKKLPPAASLGLPYDYHSVMHYPWLQIDKGATNTMYPIWNDGWAMGNWQGLSSTDVQKLEILYREQCSKRKQLTYK